MVAILRALADFEIPIYVLLALIALWMGNRVLQAWQEHRLAVFGLEKELTMQRLRGSLATLLVLGMFGLTTFCLVSFILPLVPASEVVPTPTISLLNTPVAGDAMGEPGGEAEGTLVPQPPPGTEGCIPLQLVITSLEGGQQISGQVTLTGSVDIPNFGFFKYEYAPAGSQQWAPIAAGREPVRDSTIGLWDTSQLTPGDYLLRLVVTDNQGQELPPCVIPVRILAP